MLSFACTVEKTACENYWSLPGFGPALVSPVSPKKPKTPGQHSPLQISSLFVSVSDVLHGLLYRLAFSMQMRRMAFF